MQLCYTNKMDKNPHKKKAIVLELKTIAFGLQNRLF